MSVPSFPDEYLDCESLNFDENLEKERTSIPCENIRTKENKALRQEVADQSAVLFCTETKDAFMAKNVDEDLSDQADFQCLEVAKTQEEDCTNSDGDSAQEGSVPGEDEDDEDKDMGAGEEPEELLMWVHCDNEFCDGNEEGRILVEGQPLAPEGAENPQVRNEEQGESESDEDVSYFERVPEHGSGMTIKAGVTEEDEQESEEEKQEVSSHSEGEAMKTEQKQNVLTLCFEQEAGNPSCDSPEKASLDTVVQNQQELIAEVDSDEYVVKMKDFSEDEHQDGGESLADYPSEFSSCEYIEDGGKTQESYQQSTTKQDSYQEGAVTDTRQTGRAKGSDEDRVEFLHSVDTEVAADMCSSLEVVRGEKDKERIELAAHTWGCAAVIGCETSQRDSYSSTDDEAQMNGSEEELFENVCPPDLENNKQLGELPGGRGATLATWSTYDDYNRADPADFNMMQNPDMLTAQLLLSVELQTAEDADNEKTLLAEYTMCPAEGVSTCSAAQRGEARTTSPSNQGSLDDSFFFNTELEASGVTELGQLGDDEYEEERNWEQEQERIKAFYDFYDDSDEQNGKEGELRFLSVIPFFNVRHYSDFCFFFPQEGRQKFSFVQIHCLKSFTMKLTGKRTLNNNVSLILKPKSAYSFLDSDRDSLSSSTDGEGDLSSAETSEVCMWTHTSTHGNTHAR